jgi:hypothetical protein
MAGLLQYLEAQHGSVAAYLERIGFSREEQAELRRLLTQPSSP